MFATKLIVSAVCLALMAALSACSTGWKFEIGVEPVTAIDHHETLSQEDFKK